MLAGCSPAGDPHPPIAAQLSYDPDGQMPDGCIVISSDEVERISGHALSLVLPFMRDVPGCQYAETGGLVLGTRFRITSDGIGDYEVEKARPDAVPVDGIGEDALWIPRLRNLVVVQGDWIISIGVGKIGEDDLRFEKAKEFAAVIVPRLK